jgi:2-succinyl-5-enolpyruvyl-6-hydroxy-3-cyclohexene-1-carboxylate synthase
MNRALAIQVIEELLKAGVAEFLICSGKRNAPFVNLLSSSSLKYSLWYEERSAAFYALGRARLLQRPLAIITTSGTASGELLPAMMEAYYSSIPLVAITADRPRRFRGTNAPQTAEQVGIYGVYASFQFDLANDEEFSLTEWSGKKPLHINVCFEAPENMEEPHTFPEHQIPHFPERPSGGSAQLTEFLSKAKAPLVLVSTLHKEDRAQAKEFLLKLNCPVYLEGVSGLRNDPELKVIQVYHPILKEHDAVLRIGGVPTIRLWRDLEEMSAPFPVLSITEHPFSGLASAPFIYTSIGKFFQNYAVADFGFASSLSKQSAYQEALLELIREEPLAEPSMFHHMSLSFPKNSLVFVGNSLPIRQWDLASTYEEPSFEVQATRGLSGIDGQLSTFFGLCDKARHNIAILGDLTTLYDLSAPWALSNSDCNFTLFIINNGGGKIFSRMFPNPNFQNPHNLQFEHFAKLWNLPYQACREIPDGSIPHGVVEVLPDPEASKRFWKKLDQIRKMVPEEVLV